MKPATLGDRKAELLNPPVQEGYSLLITGFKTAEQVEEFVSWYSNQGEQDADIWFEQAKEIGNIDVYSMPVANTGKADVWQGNQLEMKLDIE